MCCRHFDVGNIGFPCLKEFVVKFGTCLILVMGLIVFTGCGEAPPPDGDPEAAQEEAMMGIPADVPTDEAAAAPGA